MGHGMDGRWHAVQVQSPCGAQLLSWAVSCGGRRAECRSTQAAREAKEIRAEDHQLNAPLAAVQCAIGAMPMTFLYACAFISTKVNGGSSDMEVLTARR